MADDRLLILRDRVALVDDASEPEPNAAARPFDAQPTWPEAGKENCGG